MKTPRIKLQLHTEYMLLIVEMLVSCINECSLLQMQLNAKFVYVKKCSGSNWKL